ncbi:MAG TPA: DUF6519 domain-containing protein [Thermoanaerobaculia bacterium]|nr:DUF6519 domain-containing protein [Thermoanaerobaculia bacterium]
MKGDFSRFTFDRRKHYADVRLQQGRVQLDADWNEQGDIAAYQRHTLATDLIGRTGAPEIGGGFDLRAAGNTFHITPGRYYVDGLLCENEQEVPIDGQPDLPGIPLPTDAGSYLAYLDVWQRSVTALEDSDLPDLALNGADTATRLRTVWQVKLHPLTAGETSFPPNWEPDARPRPTLAVRAVGAIKENQLYRIEVHKPGRLGEATFKWSRDNGAVAALIDDPANSDHIQITRQIGQDQAGGFETDHWIEVTDETKLLQGQPGILVKLSSVAGQVLLVEGWPGPSDPAPDLPNHPQIRRWDSDADPIAQVPSTNDGYIDLDANLEVSFGKSGDINGNPTPYFRTGDYWVVPVRAGAGVLWPTDGSGAPLPLPPHGVRHHYAPLYVLQLSGGTWTVTGSSYRQVFEGKADGGYKLNRTKDDTMTASLTITGNLTVQKEVTVGQALTVDGALTYRDGNQLPGRVLTSDAGGKATWKTIGPIFIPPVEVGAGGLGFKDWTFYELLPSKGFPSGIRAVILEAEANKFGPNSNENPAGDRADAYIRIFSGNVPPAPSDNLTSNDGNILLRGRAWGDPDSIAWSNQGIFQVDSNSFWYIITQAGFQGWIIRVIGYFP